MRKHRFVKLKKTQNYTNIVDNVKSNASSLTHVSHVRPRVSLATCLLLVHLNYVILLHLKSLGSLVIIDAATVKQKPEQIK